MRILLVLSLLLLPSLSSTAPLQDDETLDNWHQFRGPTGNGTAPNAKPPTEWSEDKNIKWKVEIPGAGHATPIVWKDKIFILTAVPTKKAEGGNQGGGRGRGRGFGGKPPTHHQACTVICLDRKTGKEIWKKVAIEELPHEGMHSTSTFASPSPVTDGKHLFASFGSRGVFCYDFEGKQVWKRDLGDKKIRMTFGEGTSPVLHGDNLIVLWDHEGQSYLYNLNPKTGKDKWKIKRDESSTWTTPLIVEHKGVTQVIVNGKKRVRSYNLKNGKLIWECSGQTSNPIPAPVTEDGVVYVVSGFRGNAAYAISLGSKGDVSGSEKVVWKNNDTGPYVASPLLYDGILYITKERNAILTCRDAKSGKAHYEDERLPGLRTLYASITGAADKVYITGRSGTTLVLKHGKKFEVLATNKLDEGIDASPVLVGTELFLRTSKHLYCITEK